MKKLLKGFTLAEILITLGIIGVVARVTLPALMTNVSAKEVGTTLAKSINTLEVGNKTLLADTNARNLSSLVSEGVFNTDNYLTLLSNYLNGTLRTGATAVLNGTSTSNLTTFTTKDGILFTSITSKINLQKPNNTISSPKYSGEGTFLLVDINGNGSPNKLGADQFVLYIDSKGSVIPYGGDEYAQYTLNSTAIWNSGCNSTSTDTSASNRASCTGSIVDNDYKVIYSY